MLDKAIEQATFDQTLVSHPEDEFAPVLVGDLAQFVDTNAGVSRSFLQAQIALFPNWDFLHRQFTLHTKIARRARRQRSPATDFQKPRNILGLTVDLRFSFSSIFLLLWLSKVEKA